MIKSTKCICEICNITLRDKSKFHRHLSTIKHKRNLELKNNSNELNEETEKKKFNNVISDFVMFANFFEIYNTEIIYSLFKKYYSNELKEFKTYLSSFNFLSEESIYKNYQEYKIKCDNKLLQIFNYLKENKSQSNNKERKIKETELSIIIEKLSFILEKELNKNKENKTICLFCKDYYSSIKTHILFVQNKEIYYCRYIIKKFFKLSTLNEQITFLNQLFTYFFHGLTKISINDITKYIKKITINASNNLLKINKKKDFLKILNQIYNQFYNKPDNLTIIELEETDSETTTV